MNDSQQLRLLLDDAEAIDDLFRQALDKHGSSAFLEFLAFTKRFNRYSAYNTMLIQVQRPGASTVGGRSQWSSISRKINPDAIPIVILRPFGPVEFVYELSDTHGKPVPGEGQDPLAAYGHANPLDWQRSLKAAKKCGVAVELIHYGTNMAGTAAIIHSSEHGETLTGDEDGLLWRVRINRAKNEPTRFATLAHELGHIYCGHLGAGQDNKWPDRKNTLTHSQKELEAESVSWLACSRAGINTRSVDYLAGLIKEEDLSVISVFHILAAVNRVEARSEKIQTTYKPVKDYSESYKQETLFRSMN